MNRLTITVSLAASLLVARTVHAQGAACLYGGCGSTPNTGTFTFGSTCNTPGLTCYGVASGCYCETLGVSGLLTSWTDCYCVPNVVAEAQSYLYSGTFGGSTLPLPFLAMGSTVACQFTYASGNHLDIFDAADIVHGGPTAVWSPAAVQTIASAGGFTGTFNLQVLTSPNPSTVPVRLTGVSISMASFNVRGQATGPNTIVMTGAAMTGTWNQTTGTIQFNDPVTCSLSNGMFSGAVLTFRPFIKGNTGATMSSFLVQPTMMANLPATGSCCPLATGVCSITVQSNCQPSPSFWTPGGSCSPNTCPQPAPPTGACCRGATCVLVTAAECPAVNGQRYAGMNVACNAPGNRAVPCCQANYNQDAAVTVQDLFDYLAAWFANNLNADINASSGVTVQDLFDFLAAWFTGC